MADQPGRDDVDARFRAIMAAEFGPQPPAPEHHPELDEDPSEPDEYLPPEPAPLPRPTTPVLVGVLLMALALATFVADLSGVVLPSPLGLVGIVSFVAGLSVLLASLPRHPRDPWDDGSRV